MINTHAPAIKSLQLQVDKQQSVGLLFVCLVIYLQIYYTRKQDGSSKKINFLTKGFYKLPIFLKNQKTRRVFKKIIS